MEVVPVSGGGAVQLPFQRRNVQEWSRLDRLTGMLEHARVETDQWATNTATSKRKYGKVVDSRARNLADGSVKQRQRKQLEVFQAQVPGASLQVIRTQSVTSTSSSSNSTKWQSGISSQPHNFDNLKLSVHPLDLGLQKNKANVGRSGSIRTRRPPSRPRSIISKLDNSISEEEKFPDELDHKSTQNIDSRLSQVSRICQQIHETARKRAFGNSPTLFDDDLEIEVSPTRIQQFSSTEDEDENGVQIEEIVDDHHSTISLDRISHKGTGELNGDIHKRVSRRKSSSTEDLQNISLNAEDKNGESNGQDINLKRTSHIRRSLQFPPKVTTDNTNVPLQRTGTKNTIQELESNKVREVSTLKGYEALESIFRRGATIAESVNKSMMSNRDDNETFAADSLANHLRNENMYRKLSSNWDREGVLKSNTAVATSPNKRHSFVTVESLKEVRGRLRRLSSPCDDTSMKISLKDISKDIEELDDGIVTEDLMKHTGSTDSVQESASTSHVRSYVFGMEAQTNNCSVTGRRPIAGTGSLESRTSSRSNGSGVNRSEEWYNRRKSYGFEPVHSHDSDEHSKSIKFREKNKVESSTDSGICRSSEAVTAPVWSKSSSSKCEDIGFPQKQVTSSYSCNKENTLKINHGIQIKKLQDNNMEAMQKLSSPFDERSDDPTLQKGRRTVVTLGKELNNQNLEFKTCDDNSIVVRNSIMKNDSLVTSNCRGGTGYELRSRQLNSSPTNPKDRVPHSLSEPLTITIPVVPDDKEDGRNVESKRLFFRQLSEGTSLSIESSQNKGVLVNGPFHKENPLSLSLPRRNTQVPLKQDSWNSGDNSLKTVDNEMKRHSIAVDESKYVREGLKNYITNHANSKLHIEKEFANVSTSELVKRFAAMHSVKQDMPSPQATKEGSTTSGINVSFVQNTEALLNYDENSDDMLQQNGKKQKKVEFCKTEVHFAAESGRFNIVETDEKPPPSNMFRRRRRGSNTNILSGQLPDPNKNNLPEVRFGDSPYEKKLLGGNENNDTVNSVFLENKGKVSQPVTVKPEITHSMNMTVSKFQHAADKEDQTYTQANATIVAGSHHPTCSNSLYEEDEQDCNDLKSDEQINKPLMQNEPLPRSILKNNRKPRPFLLGESADLIESEGEKHGEEQEEKWGVRLRPVQNRVDQSVGPMWRSTVTLQNTVFDSSKPKQSIQPLSKESSQVPHSGSEESELQKLLRSLRPASQRNSGNEAAISGSPKSPKYSPITSKRLSDDNALNGVQVKISSASPEMSPNSLWSVADRIKQVEDLKKSITEIKGYSTRINFGGGEATIVESGSLDDSQESLHKPLKPTSSPNSPPSFHQSDRSKPIWLRREEGKQDSVMAQGHSRLEVTTDESQQVSIATAMLPSYDKNRLRSVETLVSTRHGQPKITSISLRYEGDQDVDSFRRKGSPRLLEDIGKVSFPDNVDEKRSQSYRTENSEHLTASFSYVPQNSTTERNGSPLNDRSNPEFYLKANNSHFHQKSQEDLLHSSASSSHHKNKQSGNSKEKKLNNDETVPVNFDSRQNELNEISKNNSNAGKERLHLEEKSFLSTTDRTTYLRGSKSKPSTNDNNDDDVFSQRKITYPPSKKSSSPSTTNINCYQTDKERIPSAAIKSHAMSKHENINEEMHYVNSSKQSTSCSRGGTIKSESNKQISPSKSLKNSSDAHAKFSAQNTRNSKESIISDQEEKPVRKSQNTRSSSHQVEHDINGKSHRSRSTSRGRSESPSKTHSSSSSRSRNTSNHRTQKDSCDMPIYENRNMISENSESKSRQGRVDVAEADSVILEELTRAADQILQAVNGYTDEESTRASSDDDENVSRHGKSRLGIQIKRSSTSLGTISEMPMNKQKDSSERTKSSSDFQKSSNNVRRTQRLSKTRLGQNSSTSSIESFTREVRRCSTSPLKKDQSFSIEDRAKRKITNSSTNPAMKPGSRTARLFQRASSREMLLQAHASSSEDIMSGAEGENTRKPRVPRRSRTNNMNTNKTASLTSVVSSSKNVSTPSSSMQNTSSPAAARLQKKETNESSKSKGRHPMSISKPRKSTGDQTRNHSTRIRETRRTPSEEEHHKRNSRREATERRQHSGREGTEKITGSSSTPAPVGREKVETNASERRSIGSMNSAAVVKSSTSHVVGKKKLSSSRSEGVLQTKSFK